MRRRRFASWSEWSAVLILAVFALPLAAQTDAPAAPRDVIVKFRDQIPQSIQSIYRDHDIERARWAGGTGAILMRSRSRDAWAMVRALAARPDVLYAEPNYIVRKVGVPNDTYYGSLWGMSKISAPAAWSTTVGSTGVVVGVVDTGIDYTHPDLAANVWSAPSDFTVTIGGVTIPCPEGTRGFNAITNACDPKDDESHGTHVSGTIGAVGNNSLGVAGVNWNTRIMGLKFLDANGSGYTSDAVEAIEFAIQAKQRFGAAANVRVLSNSWGGGGFSQTLANEIIRANENGILFVAAAGNNGRSNDSTAFYPANYNIANVVAVAATDSADKLASWSNYGATTVDLAAPGVSILSTIRAGGYAYYSGTSMATPHVSGAAALILSAPACTALNTAGVKAAILNNVDQVAALAGKTATNGRLNVNRAIQSCAATAGFTLSMSPTSHSVRQGNSTSYSVVVNRFGGFTGTPTFTVSGLPAGATGTFSVSGTTLNVSTSRTTPRGTYTLLIKGASGTLVSNTSATLTVTKR